MFSSDAALLDNDGALVWLQILPSLRVVVGGGGKKLLTGYAGTCQVGKHLFDATVASCPSLCPTKGFPTESIACWCDILSRCVPRLRAASGYIYWSPPALEADIHLGTRGLAAVRRFEDTEAIKLAWKIKGRRKGGGGREG